MEVQLIVDFIRKRFPGIDIEDRGKYLIMPTICHNEHPEDASKKLYLYKNEDKEELSPLFKCYTECSEAFNVYQLIMKVEELRGNTILFRDAYRMLHGKNYKKDTLSPEREIFSPINAKFKDPLSIKLPEYSETCLELFSCGYMDPWALEGIDLEILKRYKISYSKSFQGVMIPHMDWRGRFIGLRIRSYDEAKSDSYKYMPAFLSGIFYAHPLSLNLYGIYQNQKHIKKHKRCILFEAEKSVLQYEQIYDEENISLAICGKSISRWQIDMLIFFLGVDELIIGFDKEYTTIEERYNYINDITNKLKYATSFMRVGVLIDEKNVFKLKESPVDRTVREFESMSIYYIEGE